MTFLQPWLLLSLPLVALPVIIHLINQQRFQSVQWAAMMFLLSAKALSRGYTRLRQWLIMLLRMAAVAAAILAISRPLSQGWLAVVGGDRTSAAIVLLDRSPSMSQASTVGGESKLTTATRQVAAALETLGASRVVLVDSVSGTPQELASPRAIREVPQAAPAAAAADLPLLLQAACDQIGASKSAASTIWICSDQRANDWKVSDGAWSAIREAVAKVPQSVRLTLLGYTEPAADNLAVRVTRAALEPRGKAWELLLDIAIRRQADGGPARVPVQIELGPARSTVEVELTGTESVLARHAIPIDAAALTQTATMAGGAEGDRESAQANGWGRVSIPTDSNPADNDFYVAFGTPPIRRTLVVTEDSQAGPQTKRTLELIAGIPPDKLLRAATEAVAAEAVADMPLDDVALILWQAALPEAAAADAVNRFVARGGQVIFLPPESPTTTAFNGIAWQTWTEHSPPLRPSSWRADEGLLAATLTGAALPVGELELRRTCGITGEGTSLAVLPDGRPLLVRAAGDRGGVSFLATTPAVRDSDLAANGVVLYAVVQRAIDAGLETVGNARQIDAGSMVLGGTDAGGERTSQQRSQEDWRQIAGPPSASTEAGFHAGVYASRGRLLAVNRPAAEDAAEVVDDRQIETLFQGLSFSRFEQKAGGLGAIVEEVWRLFLVALLVALVVEGLLCLPRRSSDRLPRRQSDGLARGLPAAQRRREAVA
jgi:mannose/fructose-specific phosphotransferase system component IIA